MGALTLLLLLPAFGAAFVAVVPRNRIALAWPLAVLASLITLLHALGLLARFDSGRSSVQFFETHVWNERMGTSFSFGVDGLALALVLLTALLFLVAMLASRPIRQRLYFVLLLLLESAVLGVFMTRDWSLLYVFWELTLIPLFFLIDRLGGKGRHRAALNFVLYTMGGSVFMLVALLMLYDVSFEHSFAMDAIAEGARSLPVATQIWLFAGLFIGFGVKMGVFPLHGWVPPVYAEAPAAVPLVSSGILLKMGAYGLLRAIETLPAAALALQEALAALACLTMIHAGLLAWRQRDLINMLAYASISHMGVVLLGLAALNVAGLTGAVLQMVAHGLTAGLLFLLAGLLCERTHERDIAAYGAISDTLPRMAFFFIIAFFAAIGLPGTAGFGAELHTLVGGFERWGFWVVALSLSVLVSAAYGLRTLSHFTQGPICTLTAGRADMTRAESFAALLLAAGIILLGLLPAPLLTLISASVQALAGWFA